jgi:hypothetical protein
MFHLFKFYNMKAKINLLLTAIMFCLGLSVSAQNTTQDVVYLKNGGIMRGSIIEMIPEKYVKIEIVGGNIFVFQVGEIEKCIKETAKKPETVIQQDLNNSSSLPVKKDSCGVGRGYYGMVEFGIGASGGYMSGPLRTNLSFISGYRVNPWFALGGGFGLRSFPGNDVFMPLFLDLRTNFLNKRTSPYLSLQTGYAFCLSNNDNGGFLISPTLGVSVKLKNRTALNFGLSYETQRSMAYEYYYDYYPQYYYNNRSPKWTHTLSFQVGVSF